MRSLTIAMVCFMFLALGVVQADVVYIYVDAAPNAYGSPDYDPWLADAYAAAADGSFVNMENGINPDNVGTTDFEIQDEVVYSFGDLGKRLTWVYWVPDKTVDDLSGNFETSLFNYWDGEELDFYDDYYGSTWLEPTKWENYDSDGDGITDGVIGTAGMAWWGAYDTGTQEELDSDIYNWGLADETWIFTARLFNETTGGYDEYSLESNREAVPEPATMAALGAMGLGLAVARRKKGVLRRIEQLSNKRHSQ